MNDKLKNDKVIAKNSSDPEKFTIVSDKNINKLKWILVTEKETTDEEIAFCNTNWIALTETIDLTKFNQYASENDKDREINDVLSIQDDLLLKLSTKEDDNSKLKSEIEKLNSAVNTSSVNSRKESLNNNYNYNSTKNVQIAADMIPLDKYQ